MTFQTETQDSATFGRPFHPGVPSLSISTAKISAASNSGTAPRAVGTAATHAIAEFARHERQWKDDTQFVSDPAEKYLHMSYARIIGLGSIAVPMILRSLQNELDDWFYALQAITGANPVSDDASGDLVKMSAAWLNWGASRGLI